jgi:hypothetical protein
MAATSKRVKKKTGSAKKQTNAKSVSAESTNQEAISPVSDEVFSRFMYALISFQQLTTWYYSNGTDGTPNSRAAEITRDIMRLEKKYMDRAREGMERLGSCPSGWVDCGGLCMEPGSSCP